MSRFLNPLLLKCHKGLKIKERPFEVLEEFTYRTDLLEDELYINVDKGYRSDFASIPRLAWVLVGSPASGKYREAAIVHDWLCSGTHICNSKVASQIFNEAMKDLGVPRFKRHAMAWAVKVFGPKF